MIRIPKYAVSVMSVVSIGILWFITTKDQSNNSVINFPSPNDVFLTLYNHWYVFLKSSAATVYRVFSGVLLGGVMGIVIGMLTRRLSILYTAIDPIVEILRPIPPIALTPFFIIWLGIGDVSQIGFIALGSFMIVYVTVTGAIANIDFVYERAFFALGGTKNGLIRSVWLPAILPELGSALRVTLATAFALSVAAEYLGAQGGLGYIIRNARVILDTTSILVAAALLGACSYASDFLLRQLMLRLTNWMPRTERD